MITLFSLSRIRPSDGKHGCLLAGAGAGAAASSSILRPGVGGQGGYDRVQLPAQGKQLKHFIILLGFLGPIPNMLQNYKTIFRFYCNWDEDKKKDGSEML